jgi:hypothetical protein
MRARRPARCRTVLLEHQPALTEADEFLAYRARRLPTIAPMPISAVLRTGPTGLDNVFTATKAATQNPIAAPAAVPQYCRGAIQRRHTAS